MRRSIVTILVAIALALALGSIALATGGGSTVTQARLERSLPVVFANVYSQQARLLGHSSVDPTSLHAKAMCDNGGDNTGPGSTWVCLMSWSDAATPMPTIGYGKFELNVHSNDCYTASSPSSLIGFQTVTDVAGRTVTNPAFEFDGCFDPRGDNASTGVTFPSAFTVSTTTLNLGEGRRGSIQVTCGTGSAGCRGVIAVSVAGHDLGIISYRLLENATTTLQLPQQVPTDVTAVTLTLTMTAGVGSSSVDLPVQAG